MLSALKKFAARAHFFMMKKFGPSRSSNVEYNKRLWDCYARHWDSLEVNSESSASEGGKKESSFECLGDEWGEKYSVDKVISNYIYPFITKESIVAEIGVGGGRIASKVAGRTKELYCFDISPNMLKRAKSRLGQYHNIKYFLLDEPHFSDNFSGMFDFVYSFDVFVHLDLHTMWRYFNEFNRILKNGGRAFIHTANLKAPGGWERFSKQHAYAVEGHYFISPEIIDILAEHSSFRIIKRSAIDAANFYLNRDYLVVLEKQE